jgi:hypothetical protein
VWITIADPEHRGHRLGTIVEIENQRELRRRLSGLRHIRTCNAGTNARMAGINERLGFVAYELSSVYQLSGAYPPASRADRPRRRPGATPVPTPR